MNGYAVQDLAIKQAQAARRTAARELTERQAESKDQMRRAAQLIRERLPELVEDDHVDDYAIWALMDLWAAFGEGNVTRAQVLALFRSRQATLIERLGWNPWTQEGAAQ